jgi:transposase
MALVRIEQGNFSNAKSVGSGVEFGTLIWPTFECRPNSHSGNNSRMEVAAWTGGKRWSFLRSSEGSTRLERAPFLEWHSKLGIHRRMVRDAIRNAIPPARKKPDRPQWKLQAVIPQIEAMLQEDRDAPRKQKHTAHRIWQRLKDKDPDFAINERTIRKYVRKRRFALGLAGRDICIPQSYPWGLEGQVDWYEAYADLGGERTQLQVFEMRSMVGGASFHRAYPKATQQSFLEGHELAFKRFGGVFDQRQLH